MAFKLKNIFSQLKKGQKERGMFSERGKAERKEMRKTGESKFQYDVRKSRERSKQAKIQQTRRPSTYETPDPKSRLNIGREASTPSWQWKSQEHNPGDLRSQGRYSTSYLPSAPGDLFEYGFDERGNIAYIDRSKGEDAKWQWPERGSAYDKAIRERYTGSETGDLSNWYGHDTSGWTSSGDIDPMTGRIIEGTYSSRDFERKSYLPYDLAQKYYNPSYKGSEKKSKKIKKKKEQTQEQTREQIYPGKESWIQGEHGPESIQPGTEWMYEGTPRYKKKLKGKGFDFTSRKGFNF